MAAWFGKSESQQAEEMNFMKLEYDVMVNTLHRVSTKCFAKCAKNVYLSELSTAEQLCLDRCTQSFLVTVNMFGIRTDEISRRYGLDWMEKNIKPFT
mmetsp:Transcript_3952/g.6706  ORF Transcript_3952/g.6706 Transcript_3952/m.6706 type:complete len:97 (-) Transcript_3952:153-443(-)|eukprot:CAMPEP_0202702798 /NCGR_PEP_ID=MMETSP1385-20130828/15728_1 /ASSEMBLY_ACC=CAM_ASM_000861 /TAXON_ID=933848 /ORGANISM="Elphidium margaritaceum" /LENGTH=96 /DNA_ID=CAMNT_0049360517 /DNA_START=24 /DNA_END=314 /DNA_ORIENTATION=-